MKANVINPSFDDFFQNKFPDIFQSLHVAVAAFGKLNDFDCCQCSHIIISIFTSSFKRTLNLKQQKFIRYCRWRIILIVIKGEWLYGAWL